MARGARVCDQFNGPENLLLRLLCFLAVRTRSEDTQLPATNQQRLLLNSLLVQQGGRARQPESCRPPSPAKTQINESVSICSSQTLRL